MTLEQLAYQWLTHGHDKNGITWPDAMDNARHDLNHMSHVEFLELISNLVEDRLNEFATELEGNK